MKLVKCIEEIINFPFVIKGEKYWMDVSNFWDMNREKYALFYISHLPEDRYILGRFKISHFEVEHDCTGCIYSLYSKDCKRICVVVTGQEQLI